MWLRQFKHPFLFSFFVFNELFLVQVYQKSCFLFFGLVIISSSSYNYINILFLFCLRQCMILHVEDDPLFSTHKRISRALNQHSFALLRVSVAAYLILTHTFVAFSHQRLSTCSRLSSISHCHCPFVPTPEIFARNHIRVQFQTFSSAAPFFDLRTHKNKNCMNK